MRFHSRLRGAALFGVLLASVSQQSSATLNFGDSEYSLVFEGIGCLPACSSFHHQRFADAKSGSNVAFVVQDQAGPPFTLAKCKQTCSDAGRSCSAIYMYTNKFGETKCNGLKYVGNNHHFASKATDKVDYSFVKVTNQGFKTCAQLGWRHFAGVNGVDSCGSSAAEVDPAGAPVCHRNVGQALANSICNKVGARLCSVSEVQGGAVTDGSKCNFNAELVWTDTPCYLQGTDSLKTHGYFATTGGANGYTSCQLATGSSAASVCCAGGWSTGTASSSSASFHPRPPPPPPLNPPPPPSQIIIPNEFVRLQSRSVPPPPPLSQQRAQGFDDTAERTYEMGVVAAPTSTGAPALFQRDTNGDILLPIGQRVYVLWDDGVHYFAFVVAARPPGEYRMATYDVSFEDDRSMGYYLNAEQHMLTPVGGVSAKSGGSQYTDTTPKVKSRTLPPPPPPLPINNFIFSAPPPPPPAPKVYVTGSRQVDGFVVTNSDGTMTHVGGKHIDNVPVPKQVPINNGNDVASGGERLSPSSPWVAAEDASGKTYYWNKDTHETKWELPAGAGAGGGAAAGSPSSSSEGGVVMMSEPAVIGNYTPSTGSKLSRFLKFFVIATVCAVLLVLALQHNGIIKRIRASRMASGRVTPFTPEPESASLLNFSNTCKDSRMQMKEGAAAADNNNNGGQPENEALEPKVQRTIPAATAPVAPPLYYIFHSKPVEKKGVGNGGGGDGSSSGNGGGGGGGGGGGRGSGRPTNYGTNGHATHKPVLAAPF